MPTAMTRGVEQTRLDLGVAAYCGRRRGTRLVTRLRARYDAGPFLPVTVLLMEIGDFPMMRRMLLGIAERAERPA